MDQCKEALQQLAGVNPNDQAWVKREGCHVIGADRWKYFHRPLNPCAQQLPPNVTFDLPREDYAGNNVEQLQPTHVTVGVQTDYRESETQTDPYSPDCVVQPGTTPSELLQLATLTWGHGLPAGPAEVEMIQRVRAKKAWEATLPPLNDLSQLDKRRRMMEEMEAKEWAFREGEIQKLQEACLGVENDLLRQRNNAQQEVNNKRLKQMQSQNFKDMERKKTKIHDNHNRTLRKLEAERRDVAGKLKRPGIIRHYADSKAYAYLDTYEGLQELEARLFASVLEPQVKGPQPKVIKDVIKPL